MTGFWLRVCGIGWGVLCGVLVFTLAVGKTAPAEIVTFYTRAETEPFLDIFALDVRQRLVVNLTQHPANDSEFAWSPDGERLAFISTRGGRGVRGLFIADARMREVRAVGLEQVFAPPIWSPTGHTLISAVVTPGEVLPDIYRVEAATLAFHNITRTPYEGEHSLGWSPDGAWLSYIAFSYPFGYILRPDGSERRLVTAVASDGLQWIPDSQALVFMALREQTILQQSITDATLTRLAVARPISELASAHKGEFWAFWTNHGTERHLQIITADGDAVQTWATMLTEVSTPLWSTDDSALLFLATTEHGGQRQRGLYRWQRTTQQLDLLWTMPQMQGLAWRP